MELPEKFYSCLLLKRSIGDNLGENITQKKELYIETNLSPQINFTFENSGSWSVCPKRGEESSYQ